MSNSKPKNNNSLLLISLGVLVLVLIGFLCISLNVKKGNGNGNGNSQNSYNLVNYNNKIFNGLDVKLNKETETYVIDNIKLKFNGKTTDDGEGYYKYSLSIYNGKEEVNSGLFADDYYIRSTSNYASKFYVLKADSFYFLISNLGKQVNGDYFIIINNSGSFIKSFYDVSLKDIDLDKLSFDVVKCDDVMNTDSCETTTYTFSELNTI